MSFKNLVVVTGMSGAGKTTTLALFEDMGYLCIDNFPQDLLGELSMLISNDETKYYDKIVLGVNIMGFDKFIGSPFLQGQNAKVIMLNCRNDELLHRYKYNRRVHPLVKHQDAGNEIQAIMMERNIYNSVIKPEYIEIDTTQLSKKDLIKQIEMHREVEFSFDASISFQSFGYRFGIPLDADYVFDVRFLDNPYWNKLLREQTGLDQPVIDAVMSDSKTERFLYALVPLLDSVIDGCLNMDRSSVTIAIGCTGGQHRSVVIAEYLYKHYSSKKFKSIIDPGDEISLNMMVNHRDLERNLNKVKAENTNV